MLLTVLLSVQLAAAPSSASDDRSVYRVHPLLDSAVIAVGIASVAVPYAESAVLIHPRCPCDPNEVNAIDRGAIGNHSQATNAISDVTVALGFIAPIAVDLLDVGIGHELLEDMVIYAEALAVNGALVTAAKYIVERPLPLVYAGLAPELINQPGGYRSFYSGHTSNMVVALMTASMTWSLRHGFKPWPFVVTAALGLSVAVERVAAGRHFPSDVAVGFAAGALVGWAVPRFHELTAVPVAIVPINHGAELTVVERF